VAPSNVRVQGNTINTQSDPVNGAAEALFVSTPDLGADAAFTATVLDNTVNINDPGGTALRGMAVQSTQDTTNGCFRVSGNDVNYTPAAPAGVNGIRLRQVAPAVARLEGSGASAAAVLAANNPLSTTEVIGSVSLVAAGTCLAPP
jgi:hypothetical protein